MLNELNAQIEKTNQQKRLMNNLMQDWNVIITDLHDKTAQLEALGVRVEKERLDLGKMKGFNLTSFFYAILGKRAEQLEKRHQKLISAENGYQRNKHQVELLIQDRDRLLKQIIKLKDIDSEFARLISEKEELLCQPSQAVSNELLELSQQITWLDEEIREITEVINDGESIITSFESLIEAVQGANKRCGHWSDIFKSGDTINYLKDSMNYIQIKINRFMQALTDLQNNVELQRSIELDFKITKFYVYAAVLVDNPIFDTIFWLESMLSKHEWEEAINILRQAVSELITIKQAVLNKRSDLQLKKTRLIVRA